MDPDIQTGEATCWVGDCLRWGLFWEALVARAQTGPHFPLTVLSLAPREGSQARPSRRLQSRAITRRLGANCIAAAE